MPPLIPNINKSNQRYFTSGFEMVDRVKTFWALSLLALWQFLLASYKRVFFLQIKKSLGHAWLKQLTDQHRSLINSVKFICNGDQNNPLGWSRQVFNCPCQMTEAKRCVFRRSGRNQAPDIPARILPDLVV